MLFGDCDMQAPAEAGDVLVGCWLVCLWAAMLALWPLLPCAALAGPSFGMLGDWATLFGSTAHGNNKTATASWTPFALTSTGMRSCIVVPDHICQAKVAT
ncbi:TPA: hypothetical protein ACH3X2_14304 [Trebouxia sp. C0005]